MSDRRGWLLMRLSVRVGQRRMLLQFPPESRGWLVALAVVLMMAGYVLGAVPTVLVLEKSGLMAPYGDMAIQVFYAPLIWLVDRVPLCSSFFETEHDFLKWLFGL